MQKRRSLALVVAAVLAVEPAVAIQAPAQAPPTFAVGTSAVAIDVVVRDKKGRLVKDLTAADFEIVEDGAKQQVESFTVVARRREAPRGRRPATRRPSARPRAAAVPTTETPDAGRPRPRLRPHVGRGATRPARRPHLPLRPAARATSWASSRSTSPPASRTSPPTPTASAPRST
jgi:hypothetical protein